MKIAKQLKRWKHRLAQWAFPAWRDWAAVLTLHRVDTVDPQRLWYNEHLKVSPVTLERFIANAKTSGFSFLSLDELCATQGKRQGKAIVITLDDGYRDNFENGLPIFSRHSVPFCVYVATGMVEREMIFWWLIIEDIILQNETVRCLDGQIFPAKSREEKEAAFWAIRDIVLKMPQKHLEQSLQDFFGDFFCNVDTTIYHQSLPMTWAQIAQLAQEPLATIGCHGHSHDAFRNLSEQEILHDIHKSQKLLEQHTGAQAWHFCFPFGDPPNVSPESIALARKIGFSSATTTNHGYVSMTTDFSQIPRVFVTDRNADDVLETLSRELS